LGYAVAAIASDNEAYHTFHMRIESSRDPIFVESRMIDFIDTFAFTEADTERHTQAFINALLVKPRNLGAETAKYWSEIERHTYDFTARDSFIAAARALTHADIVDAFERYIATNSSSRRCLTIHMRAVNCPQTPEEEEKQVASPRWIPDIVEFKGSLAPARAFAVFSLMAHRQLVAVRKPTSKL
jgi:secreted Zn-dependent insulinase-like peptidase